MRYYERKLDLIRAWVPRRTETDNFYYPLTARNRRDLSSLISLVCGCAPQIVDGYLQELAADSALRTHIGSIIARDPALADVKIDFGRREGWYAFTRILKPALVVETGVHHGIGACVLTAALARNTAEGHPGRYVGTDIDPAAGRLLAGEYVKFGEVHYGDSLASLARLDGPISLFINDSDHSAEYEAREYEAVASILASVSVVLGDNSHATPALSDFSRAHGRPFVFFKEEPEGHWYPGAGIGISPSAVPLVARR